MNSIQIKITLSRSIPIPWLQGTIIWNTIRALTFDYAIVYPRLCRQVPCWSFVSSARPLINLTASVRAGTHHCAMMCRLNAIPSIVGEKSVDFIIIITRWLFRRQVECIASEYPTQFPSFSLAFLNKDEMESSNR